MLIIERRGTVIDGIFLLTISTLSITTSIILQIQDTVLEIVEVVQISVPANRADALASRTTTDVSMYTISLYPETSDSVLVE